MPPPPPSGSDSAQKGLLHTEDIEQALYSLGIHERLEGEGDADGAETAGTGGDPPDALYPAVAGVLFTPHSPHWPESVPVG